MELPGAGGQLGIEGAGGDPELLEEELEAVAAGGGPHKEQGTSPQHPQFEEGAEQQELLLLRPAAHPELPQLGGPR